MSAPGYGLSSKLEEGCNALETLAAYYREHHVELVGLARIIIENETRAEEVVQEVYLRVCRKSAGFAKANRKLAYLRKAVRREAKHVISRDESAAEGRIVLEHDPIRRPHPRTPLEEVKFREVKSIVRGAISSLPPKQSEAVTLIKLEGKTYAEAAQIMGCKVKTTENHMRRGLAALRRNKAVADIARK